MTALLIIAGLIVVGSLVGGEDEPATVADATEVVAESPSTPEAPSADEAEPADEVEPADEERPAAQAEPELTRSQENAVRSAESYLSFTAFSQSGLVEQLEFEDFSTADAEFAVNHLDVDWNEQAAQSAENYLEFSGFSRQGLIDQLIFEGFTQSQATFGVDATGL